MGDLIHLAERIADRSRPGGEVSRFFFALDDPISYLTAERIERALGPIEWVPVLGPLSERDPAVSDEERDYMARERMLIAEREANSLQLPLVEPYQFPMESRRAARAATFAADAGTGSHFALALLRLAFCGAYDINSVPVIEEAAAVAGLHPQDAVAAAADESYDLRLDATSRGLIARGVQSPPAICIHSVWFQGPTAMVAAANYSAARGLLDDAPQIPAS